MCEWNDSGGGGGPYPTGEKSQTDFGDELKRLNANRSDPNVNREAEITKQRFASDFSGTISRARARSIIARPKAIAKAREYPGGINATIPFDFLSFSSIEKRQVCRCANAPRLLHVTKETRNSRQHVVARETTRRDCADTHVRALSRARQTLPRLLYRSTV